MEKATPNGVAFFIRFARLAAESDTPHKQNNFILTDLQLGE